MRCDHVAPQLAGVADGTSALDLRERRHVEHCLRCQAELVQYRKLLRALRSLRAEVLLPSAGLLGEVLAQLEEVGEQRAVQGLVTGRRVAYLGGLAAATAAGAAGALVLATRHRRPA